MIKNIQTEAMNFSLEDGIIVGQYCKSVITKDDALKIIEARHLISDYKDRPTLVDGGVLKKYSQEAKKAFNSDEGLKYFKAVAFLVKSAHFKLILSFFLYVNPKKQVFPTKIFSNKDKAKKWLHQYK